VSAGNAIPTESAGHSPLITRGELFVFRTEVLLLKQNLMVPADCELHIGVMRIGVRYAGYAIPGDGALTQQGNTVMKNLALAASVMVLVAISGQAFAKTAAQNARDWSETTGPSAPQAAYAYDAFDSTIAAQPDEPDAYRYHGGPKYND
jgi:hypothetical protein